MTVDQFTDDAHWQDRTEHLIGNAGCERLAVARILVVGLGGVGGYAVEALARAGVGQLTLVDGDRVSRSNRNRQLLALESTLHQPKTAVLAARVHDINPACRVQLVNQFVTPEQMPALVTSDDFTQVIDAIDSVDSKVALLAAALTSGIPVASSMGAGGRLDPTRLRVTDLMDTQICPLARAVRVRVRQHGFERGVVAVWSDEPPRPAAARVIGSISYLPALFGLTLAGGVIQRTIARV
ncbi:tRNA threonylcarbamoyladenosine dehydratase [Rhodoferax sp. 4810]|uniref:tRNA threonylcarbamoyladenosine dehydratase n=1 Tax=Thiospirillum jenense TaxID=1653858 RepID=A0A839H404_9GAMM|nr:tRNA threonylcarbamoyladenosine dehydratase [Thiospirillum jenense]MBB1072987.1 tRNA threonylcarbamoyladenosine dehydratase [Rhodoferax jenense]MBB1124935.1 tRNA threonylcarbamoyladenosine dehydratase [Thiospirillum jenense]